MTGILIAYDADGNVTSTLDYVIGQDGRPVDFEAAEAAGEQNILRPDPDSGSDAVIGFIDDPRARGSKAWPGPLPAPYPLRVILAGPPGARYIEALILRDGSRVERPVSSAP